MRAALSLLSLSLILILLFTSPSRCAPSRNDEYDSDEIEDHHHQQKPPVSTDGIPLTLQKMENNAGKNHFSHLLFSPQLSSFFLLWSWWIWWGWVYCHKEAWTSQGHCDRRCATLLLSCYLSNPAPGTTLQHDASAPSTPPRGPRSFLMEIFFIAVIIVYGINYWIGRKTNTAIALSWWVLTLNRASLFIYFFLFISNMCHLS